MRQGDARGEGTIAGFTPEDIEQGWRTQRAAEQRWLGQLIPNEATIIESVPVPIEVTTLYELRQLRAAIERLTARLGGWDE